MLSFEQWKSKSKSSLAAARILLAHRQPVEAASRAYYAAYQMVTGVLLRIKLSPRSAFGNWAHHETLEMYLTHICHKAGLSYKDKAALSNLRSGFRALLVARYRADYGFDEGVDGPLAQSLWRDANRLVRLLQNLIERGVL